MFVLLCCGCWITWSFWLYSVGFTVSGSEPRHCQTLLSIEPHLAGGELRHKTSQNFLFWRVCTSNVLRNSEVRNGSKRAHITQTTKPMPPCVGIFHAKVTTELSSFFILKVFMHRDVCAPVLWSVATIRTLERRRGSLKNVHAATLRLRWHAVYSVMEKRILYFRCLLTKPYLYTATYVVFVCCCVQLEPSAEITNAVCAPNIDHNLSQQTMNPTKMSGKNKNNKDCQSLLLFVHPLTLDW